MPAPKHIEIVVQRYHWIAQRAGLGRPIGRLAVHHGPRPAPGPVGVRTLKSCLVLAGEWIVVDGQAIHLDHYHQSPLPPHSAYLCARDEDQAAVVFEEPRPGPADAFLLGGCGNYAHWLLDYLPLASLLREAPPGVKLLVNRDLRPFQTQALTALGIGPARLVPLEYPSAVTIARLHLPVCHSSAGYPEDIRLARGHLDWLRGVMLPAVAPARTLGRGPRRLWVSRRADPPDRRRLLNEEELEAVAGRWGFTPITAQSLTFAEQVRLFAGAEVVAGPHGAGFANLAFAPASCLLIELLGPMFAQRYRADVFFRQIAAMLGQGHTMIVGQTVNPETVHPDFLNNERYTVPPAALESALRETLGPAA